MTWIKGRHTIVTQDQGVIEVDGEVDPPFGLRRLEFADGDHAILVTHLPTGLRLPAVFPDFDTAKAAVARLRAVSEPGDWDFVTPAELSDDLRFAALSVLSQFEAAGLALIVSGKISEGRCLADPGGRMAKPEGTA